MGNKVWLITGASRGFGAEIAQAVLKNGDKVVATARNPKSLEFLGKSNNLLTVALDVTDESQSKKAVEETIKKFGRIDILVNNAGYGLLGAVEESSADEVEKLYRTNVFGLLNITRAVLPYMRKQHSGHIMNLSSLGGYSSHYGWGVYCSTKFAVEGLSEALYHELKPLGVNVTVVEPGFFRTDFLDKNSLVSTEARIKDYDETVGKIRDFAEGANHQQPGDPKKLATALIKLAEAKNPPSRLPLGSDTLKVIDDKHHFVEKETAEWRELATSTDFR